MSVVWAVWTTLQSETFYPISIIYFLWNSTSSKTSKSSIWYRWVATSWKVVILTLRGSRNFSHEFPIDFDNIFFPNKIILRGTILSNNKKFNDPLLSYRQRRHYRCEGTSRFREQTFLIPFFLVDKSRGTMLSNIKTFQFPPLSLYRGKCAKSEIS